MMIYAKMGSLLQYLKLDWAMNFRLEGQKWDKEQKKKKEKKGGNEKWVWEREMTRQTEGCHEAPTPFSEVDS